MSPILIFPLSLCVLTTTLRIRVDPVLTHIFLVPIHGISFSIETLVQSFCQARRRSGNEPTRPCAALKLTIGPSRLVYPSIQPKKVLFLILQ
ncbi:uncharacterized protein BO87DRAFT_124325 [Aspergillus neoniger CBS 115656]|uniref:Secreted protein n=1 Tax=Aspergillus neoniger (strain CBS 115656) TaxID=1448310 RepID=A0A318YAI0_ASPNB|nr:hypothetical protein BO87DRAFT_124325 [Aspergillus neoniger CBS 115656]PYH31351.1 hypothetical protein BO87DRAFT_124325 [Aspergillus neoniger CBS 115656]